MKISKNKAFILLLALMLMIVGCSSGASNPTEDTSTGNSEKSVGEGELRIALNAQPPSLDQLMHREIITRDTARLAFETLVTVDSDYRVVPMLAESVDTSDDSKTYTFHLRKGIKFHSGKEMTAEDVVASMNRWMEKSSATGTVFDAATFEARDDYTVVLQLARPSALALDIMASANQSAVIMPKEVVEAASPEGVTEYIGTGPFKFEEWKQDQYIHFTKYDAYQPVETEADGLAGKKEALVDDIYFDIVTDASTRLAGLQTGEYDIAFQLSYDDYEQVENDPDLNPHLGQMGAFL